MRALKLHWPVALALTLAIAILAVFALQPAAAQAVGMAASALSLGALVAQHAYRRIGPIRLAVDRMRLRWISRPEVELNLKASFVLESDDLPLVRDALLDVLANTSPPARLLAEGERAITWSLAGVTIRAAIEPVGDPLPGVGNPCAIEVEFVDVRRTYRAMEEELTDVVGPLLHRVDQALIAAASRKFYVTARFPGPNPYFGLFIAHLDPEAVTQYNVRFFETTSTERDPVSVRRDRIDIAASSARGAEKLARHYLTLTPPRAA